MRESLSNTLEMTPENFPGGLDEVGEEILVHFTIAEAITYDTVQGGAAFDEEMQIRTYKPFGQLLTDKQFQQLVMELVQAKVLLILNSHNWINSQSLANK